MFHVVCRPRSPVALAQTTATHLLRGVGHGVAERRPAACGWRVELSHLSAMLQATTVECLSVSLCFMFVLVLTWRQQPGVPIANETASMQWHRSCWPRPPGCGCVGGACSPRKNAAFEPSTVQYSRSLSSLQLYEARPQVGKVGSLLCTIQSNTIVSQLAAGHGCYTARHDTCARSSLSSQDQRVASPLTLATDVRTLGREKREI